MEDEGAQTSTAHQFRYRAVTCGHGRQMKPNMKPVSFVTNSDCIKRRITAICGPVVIHQPLAGARSRPAASYPKALCMAI